MTTISDKDRAEAQAMFEVFYGRDVVRTPSDGGVRRWLAVRDHVLAAHECPTVPVWRPTTAEEIQPGWEIRTRHRDDSPWVWGIAHHQDDDGDWCTEAGDLLAFTDCGWTYETTAPLPEPEPWPDELVEALYPHVISDASEVLGIIAAKFPGVRAAITGGEQS